MSIVGEFYEEEVDKLEEQIQFLEKENEILKRRIVELEKDIKVLEYSALWQ